MYESRTILNDAVERASMASILSPTETRFEIAVKRGLAKGLAYVAKRLDPETFKTRERPLQTALQTHS